jgi:hypothetical protein
MAQIVVLILGFVACFISTAVMGIGSSGWHWWTYVVNYGFVLLLLLPPGWMMLAMKMEERRDSRWSERWTLATGFALFVALALLLGKTALDPVTYIVRPVQELSD